MDQKSLVEAHQIALKIANCKNILDIDIEKNCWIAVHEFRHGVKPSEYDVREIDEDLYLEVLSLVKAILKNR